MELNTERPSWTAVESDPVSRVLEVNPAISWRAIFAGAFVGLLAFLILVSLGMAFGALGLEQVITSGGGGTGLTVGAAIWLVIAAVISLFIGGYIAARSSGVIPTRLGAIEGLVVASLFFVVVLTSFGSSVGALSQGTGALVGSLGSTAVDVARSPQAMSVMQGALAGLNLRSDPSQIAQGVTARLVQGDEEGAVNYLARQARISPDEARQRIDQVRNQVVASAQSVGRAAAHAAQVASWVLFAMLLASSIASLFGGILGARRNIRYPLSDRDRKIALEARDEWLVPPVQEEPEPRPA